jgi:hypothetical protein
MSKEIQDMKESLTDMMTRQKVKLMRSLTLIKVIRT